MLCHRFVCCFSGHAPAEGSRKRDDLRRLYRKLDGRLRHRPAAQRHFGQHRPGRAESHGRLGRAFGGDILRPADARPDERRVQSRLRNDRPRRALPAPAGVPDGGRRRGQSTDAARGGGLAAAGRVGAEDARCARLRRLGLGRNAPPPAADSPPALSVTAPRSGPLHPRTRLLRTSRDEERSARCRAPQGDLSFCLFVFCFCNCVIKSISCSIGGQL